MAAFYRIVQTPWAATAMTGEGARLHGGRWNSQGVPAVYLAESRALAALEIIVHAPREVLGIDWSVIAVDVPDEMIERAETTKLPSDWRNHPSSPGARQLGDAWLKARGVLALALPSVIVPEERILLLNPLHPDANQARVQAIRSFRFDARLVTSAA